MRLLLGILALLVFAPAAYGQGATVQADDTTLKWVPDRVTIKVNETVTWQWANAHNVKSTSANWDVTSTYVGPFSHTFPATGEYDYRCELHDGMIGKVVVTDASGNEPPPPPPPSPSEQHWANDQQPPTVFELADQVRPRLTKVRVAAVRNGARVRFRLSERARVSVRLELSGVVVESARRTFGAGSGRLTVRDRRLDGRYRVEVVARDLSGNRSPTKHASVTVR